MLFLNYHLKTLQRNQWLPSKTLVFSREINYFSMASQNPNSYSLVNDTEVIEVPAGNMGVSDLHALLME